jgi:flagellar protein FliS
MARPTAAQVYAQQSFEHAPPIKIVRMLYDGALRFIDRALACDPHDPASRFDSWTSRAEDIVLELRAALEPRHAPEMVETLTQLYLFAESQLRKARLEHDADPVRAARAVLAPLAEAWAAVDADGKPR